MRGIVGVALLVVLLVAVAAAFRLPDLAARPMHTDEAVNAVIVRDLHQFAQYRYDPIDHHGPTLPFLTLPMLVASEVRSFEEMTESQLRGVTALVGVLLVLAVVLARPLLGTGTTLATMLWIAVSPASVYYSRYYIHEILLVAFTTLALIAYGRATLRPTAQPPHAAPSPPSLVDPWWILTGVSLGAMHATKETFVIAVGAAALATVATGWWERRSPGDAAPSAPPPEVAAPSARRRGLGLAVALFTAVVTSYALYSFFGANPRGPSSSILTFETYLGRAGGDTDHLQPWWSYLTLLGYQYRAPFHWSEAAIALFGAVGLLATFKPARRPDRASDLRRRAGRFLAVYTVTMTVVYSTIPYKTPWCLLEFWVPWMALAGIGVARTVRAAWDLAPTGEPRPLLRVATALGISLAVGHLASQAYRASFVLPSSLRNPYAYAHPVPGVIRLSDYVHALRTLPEPTGARPPIAVVSDHPWPLPWYLRDERAGYWTSVDAAVAQWGSRPPEIVVTDELFAGDLAQTLPVEYSRNRYGHRPGVRFVLFVHPDLRARFVAHARESSR